jgi:hypothetical protein
MPEWLVLALILVAYIALVKFVLPKLGVPT